MTKNDALALYNAMPVTVVPRAFLNGLGNWGLTENEYHRAKGLARFIVTVETFDKHQTVFFREDMDLRATGGPLIAKNTLACVLVRRRDGRLWVNVHGFGQRHVYPENLAGCSQN